MIKLKNLRIVILFALLVLFSSFNKAPADYDYDIVVYGGTSAGVSAAIEAARMHKRVVIIESGRRVGGLTSGGLGQTDIGNKEVIGGIAREFYVRIAKKYSKSGAWTWQKKEDYKSGGQTKRAIYHQFPDGIGPYITKGDSLSGLV